MIEDIICAWRKLILKIMKSGIKEVIRANKFLFRFAWFLKNKPMDSPIQKIIKGRNNRLNYSSLDVFDKCTIDVIGNGNIIDIGELCRFTNTMFYVRGNNNVIKVGDQVSFERGGALWIEDDSCLIEIGNQSSFEDVHIAATETGSEIKIGSNCMFAYDIDIRTGDSHSIIDSITQRRLNYAKNVIIGNHVWIASHCSILKGVTILDNCVLATRSVLTKSVDKMGIILGGNPAKIIRENITWDRQRVYDK